MAVVCLAVVAHLLIWFSPSLTLQTLAALSLIAFIPGYLLIQQLLRLSLLVPERILYSSAAGYAIMVIGMLLLSYLPGGVGRWQVVLFFDFLILALVLSTLLVHSREIDKPQETPEETSIHRTKTSFPSIPSWFNTPLFSGVLFLLLIAGTLRFINIGYAEFHNDEARAALRSAAVLQGSEDVLFIHKKGPTEILIPAAIYAVTGQLNETAGRLPFALANLTGLFGVWLLGWRLFGPGRVGHLVGFTAALLLTFDGYFIGFSRIVQYQSVVFMTSVLTVAIFARLWRDPQKVLGHMLLAALLMVLGLFSHYEAGVVMLPIFVLLIGILMPGRVSDEEVSQRFTEKADDLDQLGQQSLAQPYSQSVYEQRTTAHAPRVTSYELRITSYVVPITVASIIGIALLALFYVPYLNHPQFSATYTYLTERRIGGGGLPYNNLSDVFLRTTVYGTSYYVGLMALFTLLGLAVAIRRGCGKRTARIVTQVLAVTLVLFVVNAQWLSFAGRDWAVLPFLVAFGLAWIVPKMSWSERTLWIWFGGFFLLAIFGTLKPRTHVYVFFMPWALLVGWTAAQLGERLRAQLGNRRSALTGLVALLVVAGLFGNYAVRYFVQNQPEVLRTWDENRPAGYWTAYDEPDKRALFGFPSSNGWKVIGQLYAQGEIEGNFETNELEVWGPAWYTRGQVRCKHDADWYFQTVSNLEPFYEFQEVAMNDFLSKGFTPWGEVTVNGTHKMTIHKRTGSTDEQAADPLPVFELNDFRHAFDGNTSPGLPLTYPVINPPIANPLHMNLANLFWLEGYDIEHPQPLRAGDTIRLTLFWRAQQPTDKTYKIFNQSYYGEGTMVAQKDGHPVCGNRDTWQWDPGELITDVHEIPVLPDAPDGLYPLMTGMYELEDGVRLEVLDGSGNVLGDRVHLTDIRIGVE